MKTQITITLLFLSVTLISGCGRDTSKPVDLPKLTPCTITVTQDGKPLAEASVKLHAAEGQSKYSAVGSTDAEGVAVMRTYAFNGSPEGKWKITVTKQETEYGEQYPGGSVTFSLVELPHTKAETTPLEVEVGAKGNVEKTLDVGKAVRVKL